nr:MAG TPA: Sulfotransferase [Caudoviricetes sp.]
MRGKHPEYGHVLIIGAARSGSKVAILTYARACGVEIEKPEEPEFWGEIPF